MITSKRVLAAGFVAALGLAGLGLGASNAGASADMMGGGLCDGIDLSTLTGGAAAGSAASGSEAPMATAAATGTEAAGSAAAGGGSGVNVAVLFDVTGRGDKSFNDAAAAGLDQAVADFGVNPHRVDTVGRGRPGRAPERRRRRRQRPRDRGRLPVGQTPSPRPPPANPDTHFAHRRLRRRQPERGQPRVRRGAGLVPRRRRRRAEDEDRPRRLRRWRAPIALIQKFQAGFEAGVACVNPDITVDVQYVNDDPTIGFNDPARGKELAAAMYEAGADVVYAAAGASGSGVLEATSEAGDPGDVWTIGVDSDLYQQVDADLQPYVLTSMLKRVDVATYETIRSEVEGSFAGGTTTCSTCRSTASATRRRAGSSTTSPRCSTA